MKKKIAVVGAGNAGCISALHFYNYYHDKYEIEIYHSPGEHPIERVGQGTVVPPAELIASVLDLNWYAPENPIGATFKSGILYEGWGKTKDEIFHSFPMYNMSMHYVPQKLSNAVLESGLFKVKQQTINDPEKEIDADIIIDCRGRHNRDKDNYEPLINPLNSALLYRKEGRDPYLHYTRTVATPNGWTVVPNQDSTSYGYLYNNKITCKEEATYNMMELFDVEPDGDLTFENYIAKNVCVGERTFLNGNRCGFLEPLEATATGFYQNVCQAIYCTTIGAIPRQGVNAYVREEMFRLETFILWHYQFGSKYDTPFWKYAKSLPFNPDDKFNYMLEKSKGMTNLEIDKQYDPKVSELYGQWSYLSFKNWYENSLDIS